MTTEPSDLSALVAALRAGDPSALQALYELYAAPLLRFSAFRLGEAEAAQDVVQEVFIQVWQHARTFEYRGEAALVAWLYTIANHARHHSPPPAPAPPECVARRHRATGRRCRAWTWRTRCASGRRCGRRSRS